MGAPYLVTSGPYAYVRNPLYFGNVVIYLGVATIGGEQLYWLLPLTLIYFTIQYKLIISLEEDTLVELFGEQYITYRQSVPSLFPLRGRTRPQSERESDWSESFRSERSTFFSAGSMLVLMIDLQNRGCGTSHKKRFLYSRGCCRSSKLVFSRFDECVPFFVGCRSCRCLEARPCSGCAGLCCRPFGR